MKHFYWITAFLLFCGTIYADNSYHFFVDLVHVKDKKLTVVLVPPDFQEDDVIYHLPAFVPGTYAVYNFGRFISGFKVTDNNNNAVLFEKLDVNTYKISHASLVRKITYQVEDTWHTEINSNFVFEPAGTDIEEGKNMVINTHGFFGYFEGYKANTFKIEFSKPRKFYGSTSLTADKNTDQLESYTVSDYMRLIDSPIMFCFPDTTFLNVGGAKILVSVYSPKKSDLAKIVADNIRTILNAQKNYLGGKLPIDKYAFIIYIFSGTTRSGSYGALEHSYSSFYVLPEMEPEALAKEVREFAAHEFFHIITPLSIHSEEIGNFDYNVPKMSEHLWMYEGVTEYFAGHVQVNQGLMTLEDYVSILHSKILDKENYNDTLPFTQMSLGCLDRYKDQYDNVYQKGALIGLCLDIRLRQLSSGKYGLKDLMNDLSRFYGKNKSFKDNELFSEIVRLSYPEIGTFLDSYVSGPHPLPLHDILHLVGIDLKDTSIVKGISPLGGITPAYDAQTRHFFIHPDSYKDMNNFGKNIGFETGDVICRFNGRKLTDKNADKTFARYYSGAKEGSLLKITVIRADAKGNKRKVKIRIKVVPTDMVMKDILTIDKSPDKQQALLRKSWLKGN